MALVRSIATVGGYTMLSRVLGFIRDILIARVLGTGYVADAFFVSQRFPNLFRSLFAEGAFNASFVPLFARRLTEEGAAGARRFAEQVLSVLLTVLLAFTVAAQIAMPWLMHVIAPGFAEHPEKFELAVQFTQITFPYLLFMALTALQGGVMNALGRFAHAAAAPILLNVVMILALVLVAPFTGLPGHVLAWRSGDGNWVWSFVLREQDGRTRLISRNRFRLPSLVARAGMLPMEPASLVMERKMLLGIKHRAERLASQHR